MCVCVYIPPIMCDNRHACACVRINCAVIGQTGEFKSMFIFFGRASGTPVVIWALGGMSRMYDFNHLRQRCQFHFLQKANSNQCFARASDQWHPSTQFKGWDSAIVYVSQCTQPWLSHGANPPPSHSSFRCQFLRSKRNFATTVS